MTNLPRRLRIGSLVFKIYRAGTYYWLFIANLLALPVKVVAALVPWTIRRRHAKFTNAATKFNERANSILQELKTLDRLTKYRQRSVLAARHALLEEHKHLQVFASNLRSYRAPGTALLMPTVVYIQSRLTRRKRKIASFKKIVDRIDSDTFYWDLSLWVVIPVAYGEELLGDLNEEYLLRYSKDGKGGARNWYRNQVARTLKDCLWKKVERLAAIGTLIDLLDRWFRK
jgi:hypothetical protein